MITATEVRTWIKIDAGSAKDAIIDLLVVSVPKACETFCARTFAKTSYDQRLHGDGTRTLILPERPVISVATLVIEAGAPLVSGWDKDYVWSENGIVTLNAGVFPKRRGNVHVVYEAGYDPIPGDLKLSLWKACAFNLYAQDKRREGVTSQGGVDFQTTFTTDELPKDVLEVWRRYQRRSFS